MSESVSFIGDCGYNDENGIEYITDDETGLTLTYTVEAQEDGSFLVDFGDLGAAAVVEADVAEVLEAMDTIAEGTQDVSEAFAASAA